MTERNGAISGPPASIESSQHGYEIQEWFQSVLSRIKSLKSQQPECKSTSFSEAEPDSPTISSDYQQSPVTLSSEPEQPRKKPTLKLKWQSFISRFYHQTRYFALISAKNEFITEVLNEKSETIKLWRSIASKLLRSFRTKKALDDGETTQHLWYQMKDALLLSSRLSSIDSAFHSWSNQTVKNDDSRKDMWRNMASTLKSKNRALESIRESLALYRISNFFRFVVMPLRSARKIALPLNWEQPIMRYTAASVSTSKATLWRFAYRIQADKFSLFAHNFAECVLEANVSIAASHLRHAEKPEALEPPDNLHVEEFTPETKNFEIVVEGTEDNEPVAEEVSEEMSLPPSPPPLQPKLEVSLTQCHQVAESSPPRADVPTASTSAIIEEYESDSPIEQIESQDFSIIEADGMPEDKSSASDEEVPFDFSGGEEEEAMFLDD